MPHPATLLDGEDAAKSFQRTTLPNRATRPVADATLKDRADERFADALRSTGARDPREFYRDRLRELRGRDERAFAQALDYYDNRLLPAVAADGSDPVAEWVEYGRILAQLTADGQTVQIDPTGCSLPYSPPVPLDHLILHLPTATREPALVIGLPTQLSPAQRATYELLVKGSLG